MIPPSFHPSPSPLSSLHSDIISYILTCTFSRCVQFCWRRTLLSKTTPIPSHPSLNSHSAVTNSHSRVFHLFLKVTSLPIMILCQFVTVVIIFVCLLLLLFHVLGWFVNDAHIHRSQDHLVVASYSNSNSVPQNGTATPDHTPMGMVCLWNVRTPFQPHM